MRLARLLLVLTVTLVYGIRGVHAADTASITSVSDDGAYLALDDGTKWIVSQSDRSTSNTWTVGDDVVEIDDSNKCAKTEIVNTDENGDEVCVTPVAN